MQWDGMGCTAIYGSVLVEIKVELQSTSLKAPKTFQQFHTHKKDRVLNLWFFLNSYYSEIVNPYMIIWLSLLSVNMSMNTAS